MSYIQADFNYKYSFFGASKLCLESSTDFNALISTLGYCTLMWINNYFYYFLILFCLAW